MAGLKAAEGDQQGAYDLLLRCWRFDAARECRFYHRALAPGLVRLALALGHRDIAAEVASVVAAGVALAPQVPSVRALALRCQGLADGDAGPALEAVAFARRTPLLVSTLARVRTRPSCWSGAGGETRQPGCWLRHWNATSIQAPVPGQAGVRARMRALGVRPAPRGLRQRPADGWQSLTGTERAVSLLVAEGLTNGAVARRLYISPHTVNTHLRHVFAKLGVSNRVALAAVVHHSIE